MATYPMAIANSYRSLLLSTLTLLWLATARAGAQSLELSSRLPRDPLTVQGQSGGIVDSKDCGYIAPAPNQVLTLTSRLDYLRLSLQSTGGQPTLLVEGPGGRFAAWPIASLAVTLKSPASGFPAAMPSTLAIAAAIGIASHW
ncbi:MAG: hypothetical protein HC890_15940 [Chloroflexaceae bacterium]|nr:hypothetical protein [Chloroflexaceae bacterium]